HRRHAAAADQRQAALDDAPGGQSGARAPRLPALLDAVLPALQLGLPDRDPAELRRRRAPGQVPDADHGERLPPGAPARDQASVGRELINPGRGRVPERTLRPSAIGGGRTLTSFWKSDQLEPMKATAVCAVILLAASPAA